MSLEKNSLKHSTSNLSEVSVIVCYHTPNFIEKFKESLAKSTFKDYELILMDGPGFPAKKRNDGAKLAKGQYLVFFDDDVEIEPECLWYLKSALYPSVGMTYGKLWNMEHRDRFDEAGGFMTYTGFIWSRAQQNDKDVGQFDCEEYVLAGKSASCMVKKDVFNEVGGFDESFGILGEETDLSWRVWLSGKRVLYVPNATGYHAFNTKFKPKEKHYTSSRVHYNGCRNYLTMLIKNLGKEHLWIVPIHVSIWLIAGLAMIITGKVTQGWNILKGVAYVWSHMREILTKRKKIQSERKISERNLWEIIHKSPPRGYYIQRFTRYIVSTLHG